MQCFTTLSVEELSLLNDFGLFNKSILNFFEKFRIFFESELTTILSANLLSRADLIVHSIKGFPLISARFLYLSQIDVSSSFQSGNYEFFSLFNIIDYISLDRIFLIIKYFIIGSFQNLIFLFSILCSIFMIINTKRIKPIKYYLLYLLFCLMFIFTAYLFTNIPLEFHLKNSIDRLFLQISGFFIIFLIITYRKLYK